MYGHQLKIDLDIVWHSIPCLQLPDQIIRANTNQSFYSHIRFPYRKILKINVVPESKLSSD